MLSGITRYWRTAGVVMAMVIGIGGINNCADKAATGKATIDVTLAVDNLDSPVDSTPDPNGTDIYFIAKNAKGKGIFRVSFTGGSVTEIFVGAPFVEPRGLVFSTDGSTLYIADEGADPAAKGAIFSMPKGGSVPVVVPGTEGSMPTALDLIKQSGADQLYYTGVTSGGEPAAFAIAPGGGTPKVVAQGAPFEAPAGVVVASNLTVYVGDRSGGTGQKGQVFSVTDNKAATFGPTFVPGDPLGMALTLDESLLLVSSIDPNDGTSRVTLIDVKTKGGSVFNDVIKANSVSGGLHRAHAKDIYSWVSKSAIYGIKIKPPALDSSSPGGIGGI